MRETVRTLIELERAELNDDDSLDTVLARLRRRGATPIDAIATVRGLFDINHRTAKDALNKHRDWRSYAEGSQALGDATEHAFVDESGAEEDS